MLAKALEELVTLMKDNTRVLREIADAITKPAGPEPVRPPKQRRRGPVPIKMELDEKQRQYLDGVIEKAGIWR